MKNLIKDLEFALSLKRPHGGSGVAELCKYIVERVGNGEISVDFSGNIHVDNRETEKDRTLFCAHVDTVHRFEGKNNFTYNGKWMHAPKDGPLGADDGAGIALLLGLLDNNVPGYYIFFQGEEKGGIGSSWVATNMPEILYDFDRAIAFDRKDVHSVITHQMYGRTCSDEFAYALANALNNQCANFMYDPDDSGLYTDTAEFINYIPECTNVSVGYYSEHSDKERLDIEHFEDLADAVLKIEWDKLPTSRDPKAVEETTPDPVGSRYGSWPTYYTSSKSEPTHFEKEDDAYDYYQKAFGSNVLEQDPTQMLIDALDDAKHGLKVDLLYMIAEYVMPDEPDTCVKFLDRNRLSDDIIFDAQSMINTGYDDSQVFEFLFEKLYKE